VKIWDYINPDKTENEIKENTKLAIPSIAAASTAPITAPTASVAAAAALITSAVTPASTRTATPGLLS